MTTGKEESAREENEETALHHEWKIRNFLSHEQQKKSAVLKTTADPNLFLMRRKIIEVDSPPYFLLQELFAGKRKSLLLQTH